MCLRHHLFFLFFTKKECDVLFEGLNVLAISVPEALAKEWDKGLLEQKSYFEKKEKKAFDIGSVPISQLCHPAVKRIPPFRKKTHYTHLVQKVCLSQSSLCRSLDKCREVGHMITLVLV